MDAYWFSADPEDGKIYSIFMNPKEQIIGTFLELFPSDALARLEIELKNVLDGRFWEYYYVDELLRFNATQTSTRIRCNIPGENKMDYFDTSYIHQVLRDYNAFRDAQTGRVRPPYRFEEDPWDMNDPWTRRRKKMRV